MSMFEYKYGELTDETIEMLFDIGIYPIEEDFKNEERCFIIYYDETLPDIFRMPYLTRTPVEATGWDEKWKEFIKPGFLTETLKYDFDTSKEPDSNTILINPSMAFGTGTHPTTKCAAALLEKVCRDKSVTDVGCGSGILAIAAAKRGATHVNAFDIDAVALINVKENLKLNSIENVTAWAGGIDSFKGDAQVVVANIITSVLNAIHPSVLRVKPEYIVYSGILDSEYEDFINGLELDGYKIAETNSNEEWRGVLLKCL
ncbi:MAG: hypothetical protein C0602_02685 [Denitrovibrio sp.]|mgnify:CR=1 FL=1|nr:MAG: hypothetical protein C0602_02685 [Denitrovibrio sp.]